MKERNAPASWCLEGFIDDSGKVWRTAVRPLPFRVGRRPDFDLTLASRRVSQSHAELFTSDSALWIRDLGSTNGTFVNGDRITSVQLLREGDLIHFAEVEFRLVRLNQSVQTAVSETMAISYTDLPLSLLDSARQFRTMLRDRLLDVAFQPLVTLADSAVMGFEILGRGLLNGKPTPPTELFRLATELGLEEKLSSAFRETGLEKARQLADAPFIFFNAHPVEIVDGEALLQSLRAFRKRCSKLKMVLEIHESAATDLAALRVLSGQLAELDIRVAFDDFGTGQARLLELSDVAPDFLKFDAIWVRDLHLAEQKRYEMVRTLVHMVIKMGIIPVAEGIETAEEAEICREIGFEIGQGFYFGRPQSIDHFF